MPQAESHHTTIPSRRDVIAPGPVALFDIGGALNGVRGATTTLVELIEGYTTPDDHINREALDWLTGQLQECVLALCDKYDAFAHDCMIGDAIKHQLRRRPLPPPPTSHIV